jgi:H+/Cl- antiporter ClcA
MSQLCIQQFPMISDDDTKKEYEESPARKKMRSRLLLACGAAAGVSAGFNAPIAGVFFALEIVQGAFRSATALASDSTKSVGEETIATATSGNISAILLSSVLAALTSKGILGDHLVFELKAYTLRTPFIELPLYLMLGALSGLVAFAFSQAATVSKNVFDGEAGPEPVRQLFGEMLPQQAKPVIGGLICGLVGLVFPQILFFGYETLNGLLANSSLPTGLLLSLLLVKMFTTAISAGSGLVGGTFAPSLFLGGMVGASFHNIISSILLQLVPARAANDSIHLFGSAATFGILQLADVPAYAMVGAASVLAALFRAPLTASLLLFELTRDYDVILPLMASAGVGSLVSDLVELEFERLRRRGEDSASWGDLADGFVAPKSNNTSIDAP